MTSNKNKETNRYHSKTGREMLRFKGGRIAGDGIIEDDYSETSGCPQREKRKFCGIRFPNDKKDPHSLNGPVIIVQKGKKEDA